MLEIVQKSADFRISGKKVRRIRTQLKLTQNEFAKLLGVTRVCVSKWEADQRNCTGIFAFLTAQLEDRQFDDDESESDEDNFDLDDNGFEIE